MSIADDLTARYAADLRGFGAACRTTPSGVRAAAPSDEVEAWAVRVDLANSSLRHGKRLRRLPPSEHRRTAGQRGIALGRAATEFRRAPLIAAQFLKSRPRRSR
jgi:hypothetical protein